MLADHPSSARAHYVQAELYAKEGKTSLARSELATAEQLKPGLPFANPRSVQELKAQLGLSGGAMRSTSLNSNIADPASLSVSVDSPGAPCWYWRPQSASC